MYFSAHCKKLFKFYKFLLYQKEIFFTIKKNVKLAL